MSEPTLYVKTGCPYCAAAMRYLEEHDIDYRKIDVLTNPEAMDELEEVSDQDSTPTLVWDGAVLADFDVEDLEPFIVEHAADKR